VADKSRSVQINIRARNEASGVLNSFNASMLKVAAGAVAMVAAFKLVESVLGKALDEALSQEKADLKLAAALATVGKNTKAVRDDLGEFAAALMRTTAVADDQIQAVEALLVSMGRLEGEGLKRATVAAIDFAAVTGQDVVAAASLLAKAAQGSTAALSRYGITVDDSVPKSQKFAAVLAQIEARAGGTAEALASGLGGSLQKARNALGELLETVGQSIFQTGAFKEVLTALTEQLDHFTTVLSEDPRALEQFGVTIAKSFVVMTEAMTKAGVGLVLFIGGFEKLAALLPGRDMDAVNKDLDAMLQPLVDLDQELDVLQARLEAIAVTGKGSKKSMDDVADSIGNVVGATGAAKTGLEEFDEIAKRAGLGSVTDLRASMEALQQASIELIDLRKQGLVNPEEFALLAAQIFDATEKIREFAPAFSTALGTANEKITVTLSTAQEVGSALEDAVTFGAVRLGDEMVDAAFGAKKEWGEVFRQLMKDIARAIIQALILRAITSGLGIGPFATGASGGTVQSAGLPAAQHGGSVTGGMRGMDSVRALLAPGEIVLPPALKEDFAALHLIGDELRRGRNGGIGAGPRGEAGFHLTFNGVQDRQGVADLIAEINTAVTRHGYRLVSSEVAA